MNIPETLLFPDTALFSADQLVLLQPFATVHIVKVDEDEREGAVSADSFMDDGFCQALVPHPLEKDRKRFLNLIDDIKNRKDDYAAQLSALTLASLSAKRQQETESRQQIISSLTGTQAGRASTEQTEENDQLWHARLILTIGEMLDREEYEVSQALTSLEDSEVELFSTLKGQEDDEEAVGLFSTLNTRVAKASQPPADSIRKRLLAWCRFIRGASLPPCRIWSTFRQEAADTLFENHHFQHDAQPASLGALFLPARLHTGTKNHTEKLIAFKRDSAEHLGFFFDRVLSVDSVVTLRQELDTFYREWPPMLETAYPTAEYGRTQLQLYGFKEPLSNYCGLKNENGSEHARILALFTAAG